MAADPEGTRGEVPAEEERRARVATGLTGCMLYPGIIMVIVVILAILYLVFFRTAG